MSKLVNKQKMCLLFSGILFISIMCLIFKYKTLLIQTISQVDRKWLLAGFCCYFFNYVCRSYRIRSYLHKSLSLFPDLFRITCLHGFAAYMLPVRSGDLTLPMFLKLHHGVRIGVGSRVLLRVRILDVFSLGFLLMVATFFSEVDMSRSLKNIFYLLGVVFIALPYMLILFGRFKKDWLTQYLPTFMHNDILSFPTIQELLQSLLVWFWTGGTLFCVIRSLKIPLSFWDVWFFVTVQLPLQLIPLQGFANSGNHEVGWVTTLTLLGIENVDGIALSIASHILLLSYVLLLGGLILVLPSKKI